LTKRTFIPVEPEPSHAVDDDLDGFVSGSRLVCVFDPEDELSSMVPGEKPVEERCPYASDMQGSGGTGGKTNSNIIQRTHGAVNSFVQCVYRLFFIRGVIISKYRLNKKEIHGLRSHSCDLIHQEERA
jgi:hypothetical protein